MEHQIYAPAQVRSLIDLLKEHLGRLLVGALVLGLLGQTNQARGQINAGRGPLTVRSAWTLEPGYLTLFTHTRFFGKVANFLQQGQSVTNAITIWDVQGGLSLNYGISKHFEAAFVPIIYQDTNKGGKGYNLIDDLILSLKIGSFGSKGSSLSYGFDLGVRFPTGKEHNIIFEPYSADKTSFGATALMSYARDPLYQEDGFSMHFNLGYWNHNDVGAKLTPSEVIKDTVRVLNMTQELIYGAALLFPFEKFDFGFELSGRTFLQEPPVTAFSRESITYISPSVTYKPYRWMTMHFNADIRVTNAADKTDYTKPGVSKIASLPNYPNWRITVGTKITILPTSLYAISERDILMKKAESRRELFEQIIKEQRETESAEQELERIKEERRKAEKELERLRRILEGEAERQKVEQGNDSPPPR
ncbi:MAG: hypothetical protein ONB44_20425 [candidate division KSB1 bacterium]|nr:hypothetical protein [candidate division KSB1 bacterium]MDZ7304497.1 hypothetical protein [candidate division KSB1 bacterium]MDZ7313878.1 hypothetical protein [candidate division KSB1 bacterium]